MLSVGDVLELLGIPLLGVIPESKAVLQSSNKGTPASSTRRPTSRRRTSTSSIASSARSGQHRFIEEEKRGFFGRLFG